MSRVDLGQVSIEYDTFGDASDPTILLVRGLGTQMTDWPTQFIDALTAAGFHVVIFDNRDVGLSTHLEGTPDLARVAKGEEAPPYQVTDMAMDIVGLLDALQLKRVHLVGISMGGMIAQVFAAKHSERLISMHSIMSSSGRPGLPQPDPKVQATLRGEVAGDATTEDIVKSTAEGLAVYGSPGYPESLEERMAIARRRIERSYDPAGVQRQMAAIIAGGSREPLLRSINLPVHVIHGEDDPLVPVEAGIDTAELIHDAELTLIKGMGHNIPVALAPALSAHIVRFCREAAK